MGEIVVSWCGTCTWFGAESKLKAIHLCCSWKASYRRVIHNCVDCYHSFQWHNSSSNTNAHTHKPYSLSCSEVTLGVIGFHGKTQSFSFPWRLGHSRTGKGIDTCITDVRSIGDHEYIQWFKWIVLWCKMHLFWNNIICHLLHGCLHSHFSLLKSWGHGTFRLCISTSNQNVCGTTKQSGVTFWSSKLKRTSLKIDCLKINKREPWLWPWSFKKREVSFSLLCVTHCLDSTLNGSWDWLISFNSTHYPLFFFCNSTCSISTYLSSIHYCKGILELDYDVKF